VDKKKKFSRKRNNDDGGDITYINERNRVFNKKVSLSHPLAMHLVLQPLWAYAHFILQIARYYDKYTAEIRASFERGTAL
jgi:pre-mRNA-splicing factor SYF2